MREGWIETTLGDVAEYINGFPFKPSELGDDGVPVIRIKQLLNPFEPVDRSLMSVPGKCVLKDGDVVFSWSGTLAVRVWDRGHAFLNQHLFRVVEKPGVLREWLPILIDHAIDDLMEKSHGTTMKHITKQTLLPHKTLLPPLEEQRRIVDVVSAVDSYINALQERVDAARVARNAVLHELLTAGGEDWIETTLGDLAELISRGRAPSYCETDGILVLNQKCIRNGRINFEFARLTNTIQKPVPIWATLKIGDTLINSTGVGTLGRAAYVAQLSQPTTFDSHLTIVRPLPASCFPAFIGINLNFRESEIELFAGGSTGQTELSREAVKAFPIALPPIEEQRRIVGIVSSMDESIQSSEAAVVAARTLRSGLLSDLLSGEHEIPVSYDELLGVA